ncbi:unnamed protein product [Echinostoma caproni]|uniref:Uncharacterized protein n=1 Tax=Echinostoma caproni TaxID=27848 RepID=A0A183B9M9_9TREM|nr:unnamed protein product [Echinostoma caproni]
MTLEVRLLQLVNDDQLCYVIGSETQTTALRISILDAVCLLQTALNSSEEVDNRLVQLQFSLQSPVALLISAALVDEESSGSEALFEPGLRLWRSMVTGPQATWCPAVASIFPLLVGAQEKSQPVGDARSLDSTREPLINRLDSAEQAELFFSIAERYLNLVNRTDSDTKWSFLSRWTEPFWTPVLEAAIPKTRSGSGADQVGLGYLYSNAASLSGDDDSQQDSESQCR